MTKVEPLVIKLAETQLDEKGVQEFAEHYGATEWLNRARPAQPNNAEFLIELSGRSCYKSFGIGLNPNVTKIREDSRDYLTNVLQKGDGSILEHATVTFAFLNVSRVTTHEIVRHRAGTAMCLPGETLIASVRNVFGKPNGTRKRRLDYLFNLTKFAHGRSRVKLLRLRVLNERDDRFTKGAVSKIVCSGEKPVFEVESADGSKCKMTKDHALYTSAGWLRLEDLVQFVHVSDSGTAFYGKPIAKVAVNGYVVPNTAVTLNDGSLAYRNKEWLEQNIRDGLTYSEIGRAAGVSGHTVRAWSGKLGLKGLSKSLKLYARAGNGGMHHELDYTRTDPERRAIALLDVARSVSGSRMKPRRVLRPKVSEVKSIRYCGIQRTYDIFMEPPHHNYVANGFIVHNSQESLRYVRPREIALWTPPDLEPVSDKFKDAVEEIKRRYRDLETSFNWDEMTFEQKKRVTSALRRILPDGIATNLIWTANHRTIRWVIEMRTHPSAEVEIRKVFGKVAEICMKDYPLLYGDFTSKKLDDGTTQYIPKFSKV